jgi:hypothetical protein
MADNAKPPVLATETEVAEHRAEQEQEYGTYIAIAPIQFNGALAFNPGDPVPASNVKRYNYEADGYVAKVTTKAAQQVVFELHRGGTATAAAEVQPPVTLGVPVRDA